MSNQGLQFIFGKKNNYHQIGNALEIDITLRKNESICNILNGDGNIDEHLRLVNIAFAYVFSIATLSTTGGEEIEVKNTSVISQQV